MASYHYDGSRIAVHVTSLRAASVSGLLWLIGARITPPGGEWRAGPRRHGLAMRAPVSVDWCGYWQRAANAAGGVPAPLAPDNSAIPDRVDSLHGKAPRVIMFGNLLPANRFDRILLIAIIGWFCGFVAILVGRSWGTLAAIMATCSVADIVTDCLYRRNLSEKGQNSREKR
jgi:hypothetical protein